MTADTDGTLEVTVPVRAGSRLVGATFLATNYRPSLDIIRQYDRKSLENNTIPQIAELPGDRLRPHPGPVQRAAPGRLREPAEGVHVPPARQRRRRRRAPGRS